MSRRALINELVDNGYEPGVLDGLNNGELAVLVQEEFVENKWTDAARAARKFNDRSREKGLSNKAKVIQEKQKKDAWEKHLKRIGSSNA